MGAEAGARRRVLPRPARAKGWRGLLRGHLDRSRPAFRPASVLSATFLRLGPPAGPETIGAPHPCFYPAHPSAFQANLTVTAGDRDEFSYGLGQGEWTPEGGCPEAGAAGPRAVPLERRGQLARSQPDLSREVARD